MFFIDGTQILKKVDSTIEFVPVDTAISVIIYPKWELGIGVGNIGNEYYKTMLVSNRRN